MKTYLLLYSGGGMPASEAEGKAVMQAWTDWFAGLGSALVDGGNPFSPAARSIAADGRVGDVPAVEMASGYSIIRADSLDAAVTVAKGCPVLLGGSSIRVFETFDVQM
jgi:hypothetical protein